MPDPVLGAVNGVGPPPVLELAVPVERVGVDVRVVFGAGGLGGKTVRTASTAVAAVDVRLTAGRA